MKTDLPNELWHQICTMACRDDGRTGMALSSVSRRIRAVSQSYRYQSVCLLGLRHIEGLTEALRVSHETGNMYPVRYLFIRVGVAPAADNLSTAVAALRKLLEMTSATVTQLAILWTRTERFKLDIKSLSFPRLQSLVIRGSVILPHTPTFSPLLERLDTPPHAVTFDLCMNVAVVYPNLTHFRVYGVTEFGVWNNVSHEEQLHRQLFLLMGAMGIRPLYPGRNRHDDRLPAVLGSKTQRPTLQVLYENPDMTFAEGPPGLLRKSMKQWRPYFRLEAVSSEALTDEGEAGDAYRSWCSSVSVC